MNSQLNPFIRDMIVGLILGLILLGLWLLVTGQVPDRLDPLCWVQTETGMLLAQRCP